MYSIELLGLLRLVLGKYGKSDAALKHNLCSDGRIRNDLSMLGLEFLEICSNDFAVSLGSLLRNIASPFPVAQRVKTKSQ